MKWSEKYFQARENGVFVRKKNKKPLYENLIDIQIFKGKSYQQKIGGNV